MELATNSFIHICFCIAYCVPEAKAEILDWIDDELDCYDEKTRWVPNRVHVPIGVPWRAFKSLPSGIIIAESKIPDAGLGVISNVFIPRYTWLEEFEGEIVIGSKDISDYAWNIWRGGERYFFVDARDEDTSNWLRYINCARKKKEENVLMVQCFDKPYYLTQKDVYPGDELLVYYGDGYAKTLDIDVENYMSET